MTISADQLRPRLRVYLLTDFAHRSTSTLFTTVETCLRAGVTALQYRDKTKADSDTRRRRAARCSRLARRFGALFIVNDDLELALEVEADGVHLGPGDLHPEVARRRAGPQLVIGGSAGLPARALELAAAGVDYLGVGAVYDARPSKPDASTPRGPAAITAVRAVSDLPLVGIGGIAPENARPVFAAGADGVAVIRSVLDAPDPAAAVIALLDAAAAAR
jgi:thiamine-phosphate pyrophosphorylase